MPKQCLQCKFIKPDNCFHIHRARKDGLQVHCKTCRNNIAKRRYRTSYVQQKYQGYKKFIIAHCSDCRVAMKRLVQSFKNWKGRCRSCAMKEMTNRPTIKARKASSAREQVLRQGGIPNARHFTSEMVSGANGCNWKGGITPEIIRIRTSTVYAKWRKAVFERDNYTCQMCGQWGGRLNADHIKRFRDFPELRFEISNGRTLCDPCHRSTPTYGRKLQSQSSA